MVLKEIITLDNKTNKKPKEKPFEVVFLGYFWVGFLTANPASSC